MDAKAIIEKNPHGGEENARESLYQNDPPAAL